MEILRDEVNDYVDRYASPLDALLAENETATRQTHPEAHMISGHVQGKVLEMLSLMIRPQKILEIGTFTGFSALCLAKGLAPDGVLHTIEIREEDARKAQSYFDRSSLKDQIILHVGNAKTIILMLQERWDLVFLDADKTGYIDYYELILPALKPGGWLLADNVLFHGEVLAEELKGKNAKAIQQFNDHVKADERVEHVMLTVRDGLMLIRKK
jgi:predicted O-methyltransferase YrrM